MAIKEINATLKKVLDFNDKLLAQKNPKKPDTRGAAVQTDRVKIEPIDTVAPWTKFDVDLKE